MKSNSLQFIIKLVSRFCLSVLLINFTFSCFPKKDMSIENMSSGSSYVGTLKGAFSVSHDGDAVYKVPILLPPGTNGMAPTLTLSYYSSKKNGPLGMGFRLTGISSIKRVGATIAQDGFTSAVSYNELDRFLYDGERLIKTKDYGQDSTIYHTEIESWRKIVSMGSCGSGPCSFKVYTKNGYIKEFGMTNNSRIQATHKKGIENWTLNKIVDQFGNYIEYIYLVDSLNGSHYPTEIKYTGNSNILVPQRAVKFEYDSRMDSVTTYEGGSKSRQTKRLKTITTFVEDKKVLSYNLDYQYCETTGRSQLIQIKECDGLGKCLLPTTFKWQQGDPSLIDAKGEKLALITKNADGLFPMDINADGLVDLVSLTTRSTEDFQIHTYKSDGNQLINTASQIFSQRNRSGQIMPLDINGDGKMDLLYAMNTTNTSNGRFSIQLYKSDGEKFENPTSFESEGNITRSTGKIALADVNGDGRTDLLYYSLDHENLLTLHTFLSDGSTFRHSSVQNKIFKGQRSASLLPLDINGDGRTDLVYSNSEERTNTLQTYILISTGDSFHLKNPQELKPSRVSTGSKLLSADLNADGMQDLIYVTIQESNPIRISTFFSNGTSFESGIYKEGGKAHNGQLMTADVNGDERTDLIIVSSDNNQPFQIDMYLSNGTNFQSSQSIRTSAPRNGIPIPMDMDGDAKTDIIYAIEKYDEFGFTKFISKKSHPDLISSFHNGIGGRISIDYKPLTDTTVHTQVRSSEESTGLSAMGFVNCVSGTAVGFGNQSNGILGAAPPLKKVAYPVYIVANYSKNDGRGNEYTYHHKYAEAKVDLSGRGWLGFRHKIDIDSAANQYSKHTYHQIFPFTGLDDSSVKYRLSDHSQLIRKRNTYINTFPVLGNRRIHQVRRSNERKDHYTYGKFEYTLATDYQYDHFGNPGLVIKRGDTTSQNHILYSRFVYENDTVNWQIGHLNEIVKSADPNFRSPLYRKEIEYDDKNKHIKAVKLWNDQLNTWEKHQYLYDQWGNKTHDISNSNDTTQYVFDQKYHSFLIRTILPQNDNGERLSYLSEYEPCFGINILETDPNGNVFKNRIDKIGRTTEIIGPNLVGEDEVLVRYSYTTNSEAGYLKKTESKSDWQKDDWFWSIDYSDGLGRTYKTSSIGENINKTINTKQLFDSKDRVVKQSLPYFTNDENVYWITRTYNEYDLITQKVTPNGETDSVVMTVAYDGKKIILTNAANTVEERRSEIHYDYFCSQRKPILRINPAGDKTHFTYDAAGRITSAKDPSGIMDEIFYNSLNQTIELKNQSFGKNTYITNESLKHDKHITASRDTITYSYDKVGRIIAHKISDSDSIVYQYDLPDLKNSKGNLSKVILPNGQGWYAYTYDAYGNPETVVFHVDGKDFISKSEYTPGGQIKKFTYPDGAILTHNYNPDGSLKTIELKDDSQIKTYADFSNYTVFGQPRAVQFANGVSSKYEYHVDGKLNALTIADKNNKLLIDNTLRLNKLKQIVSIKDKIDNSNSQHFKYCKSNRLIAATGKYGNKKYEYDASGNLILKDSIRYQYDNFQIKKGIKDNVTVLAADYDRNGNMIKRIESDDTTRYQYDVLNRLTSVEKNGKHLFTYGYDHTEQRIEKIDITNNTRTLYISPAYEVTNVGNGEILHTKYIKGLSGNIASITKNESQLSTWIGYDESMLKNKSSKSSYLIGLVGSLKRKVVKLSTQSFSLTYVLWTIFILCLLAYLRSILSLCMAQRFRTTRWIILNPLLFIPFLFVTIFGAHPALANTNNAAKDIAGIPETGVLFFHQDHSQSTSLTTDAAGNESGRTTYTPYGKIYEQSGADNYRAKYGGKELEKEIGLYYYNARYYDPGLGRFISADSHLGGSHLRSDAFNRYAYAFNNPVNYVDPSGHIVEPMIGVNGVTEETIGEALVAYFAEIGAEIATEDAVIDVASGSLAPETLGISLIVGLIIEVVVNVATIVITTSIDVGSAVLADYVINTATQISSASSPPIAKATISHGNGGKSNSTQGSKSSNSTSGNNNITVGMIRFGSSSNSGISNGIGGGGDGDDPNKKPNPKSSHEMDVILDMPEGELLELISQYLSIETGDFTNMKLGSKHISQSVEKDGRTLKYHSLMKSKARARKIANEIRHIYKEWRRIRRYDNRSFNKYFYDKMKEFEKNKKKRK